MTLDYVGRQLGNYHLVQLLGKGGFAHVYRGEHTYLHSQAALKILQVTLSEKEMRRFQTEAQTLVHLLHPHIIRVLDFFVTESVPILVMEYAAGGTIRQCHARGSRLPLQTVVDYTLQIGEALHYAHTHGVIHRDIKPDNILLDNNKQLLLSDFGLALFTPSPEQLSVQDLAGTLYYMAPEQLRGKPTFASDQYSLAVMVYEWLCGSCPFAGTYWELMHQHMDIMPQSLRQQRPELPLSVEKVVLKALAKDPQERFTTILDFANALKTASQEKNTPWSPAEEDDWKENSTVPMPVVPPSLLETATKEADTSLAIPATSTQGPSSHIYARAAQVPTSHKIYLSASPADIPIADYFERDLKTIGIMCVKDALSSFVQPSLPQNSTRQQILQHVNAIVILVSSQTRTAPYMQELIQLSFAMQIRLICIWIEGEEISTTLPITASQRNTMVVIDARADFYASVIQKLWTYLQRNSEISASFNRSAPQNDASLRLLDIPATSLYSQHNIRIESLPSAHVQIKDIVATVRARSGTSQPFLSPPPGYSANNTILPSPALFAATPQPQPSQWTRKRMALTVFLVLVLILSIIPLAVWRIDQHHLVVDTSSDVGSGSLRQILEEAQPGDTISFTDELKGKTIHIDQGTLTISKSVFINGADDGSISLSTGKSGYNIHIMSKVSVTLKNLTLTNSVTEHRSLLYNQGQLTLVNDTLSNNIISASSHKGHQSAVIYNYGTLAMQNTQVEHNQMNACTDSSSIYNSGKMDVHGGRVFNNSVDDSCLQNQTTNTTNMIGGSGITNAATGVASLAGTVIANNVAAGSGGGIANIGTMTITDSMVAYNRVDGPGGGGGIYNQGTLTVQNSSINENTAEISPQAVTPNVSRGEPTSSGGGIANNGNLALQNSTIAENVTTISDGTRPFQREATLLAGGGLFNDEGTTNINFCTFYGNNAQEMGGGIFADNDAAHAVDHKLFGSTAFSVHIRNSIVAANKAGAFPDISGIMLTGGYNLIQNTTGTSFLDPTHIHHTDITNLLDQMLHIDEQSHRDYGQVGVIHSLLPGSPAINRIPPSACDLHSDQRHVHRPQLAGCDIGSFEFDSSNP